MEGKLYLFNRISTIVIHSSVVTKGHGTLFTSYN